jgi:hypothetical protein
MVLRLRLRRETAAVGVTPPIDPGRAATAPDLAAGATRLALIELPGLDDAAAATPDLFLAAAGTQPGWRRAEASLSLDGGASWRELGRTALPAVIGHALTALGPAGAALFDQAGWVEIALLHDEMVLQGADAAALVAGANLALLGDELIQFGTAEQTGPGRYRLSRLTRGRRGTEDAIGSHAIGERFVLLDRATLLPLALPAAAVGGGALVTALGPGDMGGAVAATVTVGGLALRPPAPVHPTAMRLADGTLRFAWVRRSR